MQERPLSSGFGSGIFATRMLRVVLTTWTLMIARRRSFTIISHQNATFVRPPQSMRRYPSPFCLMSNAPHWCLDFDAKEASYLRHALSDCKWHRVEEAQVFDPLHIYNIVVNGSRMQGGLPYDELMRDTMPMVRKHGFGLDVCSHGEWDALRIGPFSTTGGYYWPSILGTFLHANHAAWRSAHPPLVDDEHDAFAAYVVGSINAGGALIGYPPIHQHHFHFGSDTNEALILDGLPFAAEIMGTHGENQCREEEGGVDCYVRSAPPGTVFVHRRPLGILNSFNDVRPEGSLPLASWLLVAVRVATTTTDVVQPRRVSLTYLIARPPPHQSRGSYVIDAHMPSFTWHTGHVRAPLGSVLEAYFHAHAELVYDAWLFAGDPAQVFSDMKAMNASWDRLDYAFGAVTTAMQSIRARRAQPDAAPLVCAYRTSSFRERLDVNGGRQEFQRKAPCPLGGNTFADGRSYVIMAFHAPPSDFSRATARVHAYIKLFYAVPLEEPYRSDFL